VSAARAGSRLERKPPLSAARNRDTTRLSCCGVRPPRCTAECDGRVDVGDVCRLPRMVDTAHTGPPPATGTLTVGGSADCGESPSGAALAGLAGVDLFLPSLSPEAPAEDEAYHDFLIAGMDCAHAGTVNRARVIRRFSKREVST